MKKRILNMLLTIVMMVGLVPGMALTASAEVDATSAQKINLGYSIIENGDVQNQRWDYIYFGNYSNSPLKWRVLSNKGVGDSYKDAAGDAYTGGALFLMTEYLLEEKQFGTSNVWEDSDVRTWCNDTFVNSAFSDTEKDAILLTSKSEAEEYMFQSWDKKNIYAEAITLTDEAVFFPSAKEIRDHVLGSITAGKPAYSVDNQTVKIEYWSRTPLRDFNKVFFVNTLGNLAQDVGQPTSIHAARPAFHLNASNVLMTSAAVGGKPDGFGAVQAYDGNEWKITLLDNTRSGFAAEVSKTAAKTYAVHYSGAATGSNEYISAIIVDNSNNVESYGRLCPVTSKSGTTTVTLPDTFDASNDTLYIFNEQYNGDYRTDYVSNLIRAAILAEISNVSYLDAAGEEKICESALPVNSDMTTLTSGWYCVNEDTIISSRITVSGDVHIILCDGATLTANDGIGVNSGNSLTIYGQKNITGKLTATATSAFLSGIGGGGDININGGRVEARGAIDGAAIGGNQFGSAGNIFISGGFVTANGGRNGAGIGGGRGSNGGWVVISGGTIAANIGDGWGTGVNIDVIIEGGSVNATVTDPGEQPKNLSGQLLTRHTVTVPADYDLKDLMIKNADGTDYAYGRRDMQPDASGNLYLWLPEGVTAKSHYAITYQTNGGTISGTAKSEYLPGDTVDLPKDVTKTGHTFAGWYENEDFTGESVTVIGADQEGDKTFYAKWTVNQYTITFDTDGGTVINSITQEYGTQITAPQNPIKEGHTFVAWSVDIPATMPAENLTIKAIYTINHHLVTFKDWDGKMLQFGEVTWGDSINTPAAPTRTGYTFTGWDADVPEKMPDHPLTFTAQYRINQYTITFDSDGGTAVTSITQDYNTAVNAPANPTKVGYTFAGWNKEIPTTMPAENMTITALWTINQYKITFDTDGGTAVDSITQNYGAEVVAPTAPTKTGYTFAGWKTADGKDFTFNGYTMPAENITLTARWNPASGTAYTVNHHFQNIENDGYTVDTESKYGITEAQTAVTAKTVTGFTAQTFAQKNIAADGSTVINIYYTRNKHTLTFKPENGEADIVSEMKYGAPVTAPADPIKTGYTFNGWGEVADTMPDNDLTYTALWIVNRYTITFNVNGGTAVAHITQDYNTAVEKPADPTKTGYDFGGWYADKELSTPYVFGTMPAANITVYAKWNPAEGTAYTVKHYHQNTSGSGYTLYESETLRGTTNDDTAATAKNYPGFTAQTFAQTTILPDGSAVVEIKYDRNIYSVTLVTNGGTVRDGDITEYTYGVGTKLPTNVTRSGYYFGGWYDNEDCKGTPVTEITTTDIGIKTFYAKWDLDITPFLPLLIKYDVEVAPGITGGVVTTDKISASVNDKVNITVVPFEDYEIMTVMVTDAKGNAVTVTETGDGKYSFKMPMRDVTVYAVFNKTETPITTETCPCDYTCPMYPFADLDMTAWYHDGVHFCIEHGLMVGTGTNIFEPNIATSRAMIVTILWRLEGSPIVNYAMDFEDVAADQWYTEAIRWAASEKIVEGYGNGYYGTNDAITREQMVTIMFRYAKYKGYDVSVGENTNILSYDDAFDVAEWAIPSMQWACGSGMIQGIADGNHMNLAPQGNATRAQAAAILQRFGKNVANKE